MDAALAGEPQPAGGVERGSVEVGTRPVRRQRKPGDVVRQGIDSHDRIQATVGNPGRTIRADDHTVGPRPCSERDVAGLPGSGIEPSQVAGTLGRVPDTSVGCGGDVVRPGSRWNGIGDELHLRSRNRLWGGRYWLGGGRRVHRPGRLPGACRSLHRWWRRLRDTGRVGFGRLSGACRQRDERRDENARCRDTTDCATITARLVYSPVSDPA